MSVNANEKNRNLRKRLERRLTKPGTCTSIRNLPNSSLDHDHSSGISSNWPTLLVGDPVPFTAGFEEVETADFFKMPLRPGNNESEEDDPLAFEVEGVELISWISGLDSEFEMGSSASSGPGIKFFGIWTVRGKSFPLLARFGVPMDLESTKPD